MTIQEETDGTQCQLENGCNHSGIRLYRRHGPGHDLKRSCRPNKIKSRGMFRGLFLFPGQAEISFIPARLLPGRIRRTVALRQGKCAGDP
jgi:hypothetical protein